MYTTSDFLKEGWCLLKGSGALLASRASPPGHDNGLIFRYICTCICMVICVGHCTHVLILHLH